MASKLTVAVLKKELEKLGLPATGLKSDLVARLEDAQKKSSTPDASTKTSISTGSPKKRTDREPLSEGESAKRVPARREQLFALPRAGVDVKSDPDLPPSSIAQAAADETYPEQTYLNKHIGYTEKGLCQDLSQSEAILAEFIASECQVPADFSINRKYGASRSGLSYENRLIAAFVHGLLDDVMLSPTAQGVQPAVRKAIVNNDYDQAAVIVTVRRHVSASQ